MHRLALSLLAVLIGWALGFIYFAAYLTFFTPWGRLTDVQATLFWSGLFVLFAWMLFVLPLVFLVPESSPLFSLRVAPAFGGVSGLVAFLLLVGWWTGFWAEGLYLGYALVVGAGTGLGYSIFLKLRRRMEESDSSRAA